MPAIVPTAMEFTAFSPPDRPMTMETITVATDQTASLSRSPSMDVDMRDADRFTDSEDDVLPETPCRDGAALRGGMLYPPPNVAWMRKVAVSRRKEIQVKTEPDITFADVEETALIDDSESTSSDWDRYGDLTFAAEEYEDMVARLEGSEDWNAEQRKLHKLLYMRGLHPMMPSWWRVSFKMWGVTQPHLNDVFTPKNSKKRVAIHAYGNEVAAAKALESLFYLSQTVTDYEEIGYQTKIASTVVKTLRGYITWALRDAGIDKQKSLLNMFVQAYPPDFRADDDSESAGSEFAPSVASDDDGNQSAGPELASQAEDTQLAEMRRAQRFTRSVSRDIERRLMRLGQRWRDSLWNKRRKAYAHEPPTLYAFAVIQHIVLLASHDPSSPENPVIVLEQVPLNDRGQWLWNALSLALPVNLARDSLCGLWDTGNIVALQSSSKDDPDL